MHCLALRHVLFEDLSSWSPVLKRLGWTQKYHDAGMQDLGKEDALAPDLLVILGGPIGVYDAPDYPFLSEEIAFVRRRIEAGRATLGVCLGAQILAAAAGARVYPSDQLEAGFLPITLTKQGRASCLSAFAAEPTTLHWHKDTFDLPKDAVLLASSAMTKNQAFALSRKILGVQFHPEWGGARFEHWLVQYKDDLQELSPGAIMRLRTEANNLRPSLATKAEQMFETYLGDAGLA
jgi:GMP synthase (glutamine-hydrolysing)